MIRLLPLQRGQTSAITPPQFQARAVGPIEAHAGVEREAATVIPFRHRLGLFRFKHTAPGQRAQQTTADLGLSTSLSHFCLDAPLSCKVAAPEASASKTSSMIRQWKCTYGLSSAPKRRMKATAPMRVDRSRGVAGMFKRPKG